MSELARLVAETILEDRHGENVFRDPVKLTHYLLGSYASGSGLVSDSRAVADSVLEMLEDDADAECLAAYVERSMSAVRDQARGS